LLTRSWIHFEDEIGDLQAILVLHHHVAVAANADREKGTGQPRTFLAYSFTN
jgi:hypothetical protein